MSRLKQWAYGAAMLAAASFTGEAMAYFGAPGTQVPVYKTTTGNTSPYGYYEYLPANYSETSGAKFPIILSLHGKGEMGDGGSATLPTVLRHGPPKLIQYGKTFPAIVVSPQTSVWWQAATIDQFVTYLLKKYPAADPTRLYVVGLSMGGGGTWDYAAAYPNRVAAIVPVCAYAPNLTNRAALFGKGIWAFHAFNDPQVSRYQSIQNIDAVTPSTTTIMSGYPNSGGDPALAASTDMIALYTKSTNTHRWYSGNTTTNVSKDIPVRFTMYQTGGHDSWTRAFNNTNMWNWLYTWTNPAAAPAPLPQTEIRVDFGNASLALPSGWNNGRGLLTGSMIDLRTSAGTLTPFDLVTVSRFNSVNANGTTTPSSTLGLPKETTLDSFYGNTTLFSGMTVPKAVFEVRGLSPSVRYSFEFFGSRMATDGKNRETRYTVIGSTTASAALNTTNNSSVMAKVSGILPNSAGVIRIEVTKGANNNVLYGFFYLGSMKIRY